METFDLIDGVWVAHPRFAVPLAIVLRQSLIDLAGSRHRRRKVSKTKMELMYLYLTGPRFRQRIDAIVEKFTDMQNDLDRERKMMMRLWAKREEQLAASSTPPPVSMATCRALPDAPCRTSRASTC